MIAWLESLPTFLTGIVIVGGFVVTTMLFGYLVRVLTPEEVRAAHTDRAGFILAVIGVIYAVLLAFVAIGVWERFEGAEARSYDEAQALATIYRDAENFPRGGPLRSLIKVYARSIIDVEWPDMRGGEKTRISPALIERIGRDVRGLDITSPRLQNLQARMLGSLETAWNDRESRLTLDFIGINSILWVVLILGAYITVGFTYLFGWDDTVMQQLMIGGLSLMIGLVMFLVMALDFPFRGSIAVGPDAFEALLRTLNAL
ncbi:MAG TPA: hypothetical protein VKE42_07190 [Candidatus Cybelea sp.]|nr:hypothetical protein [Candidatus Cybelea sp.]